MLRVNALPRRAAAWVLLSAATALVSSGSMAAHAQTASAPTAIKATELEPTPDPSLSFNDMANAMGLFAKYGLTYEAGPKLGGGGPARVQAIVTGNTDVATSDIISVMGGIYSGAKIKILMVMTPYGDEEVLASNKYKTLKDALGQPWGVASLGGAQRFNAQMAVEGMGLKSDAFRWTAISGADAARLEALDTGRTQLASLSHLAVMLAEAKGYTKQVHVVIAHTSKHTPPVPRLVVVASDDWLKGHQAEATRYVEMMLDANRQWENNADFLGRGGRQDIQGGRLERQAVARRLAGIPRRRLFLGQRRHQLCGHAKDHGSVLQAAQRERQSVSVQTVRHL